MKKIFTLFVSLFFISWLSQAQPTTQASDIIITPINAQTAQLKFDWTPGNVANKVLVVISESATASFTPTSGSSYAGSTVFTTGTDIHTSGTGRSSSVLFNSTNTTVTVSALAENTDYLIQVFEYTGAQLYNLSPSQNNPRSFKYRTTTGTTASFWTPPTGITNLNVQAWGGGGGGGGADPVSGTHSEGGGGGAGGTYSTAIVPVIAPTAYSVNVGIGGPGGSASTSGTKGGDSWFSSALVIAANGGALGTAGISTGGGASGAKGTAVTTGSVGTATKGGDGANGNAPDGGGGGSSGGTGGAQANAVGRTAGTAITGAGNGSAGVNNEGDANNASFPGGGGGGAGNNDNVANAGGDGGPGLVIISFSRPNAPGNPTSPVAGTDISSGENTTGFNIVVPGLLTSGAGNNDVLTLYQDGVPMTTPAPHTLSTAEIQTGSYTFTGSKLTGLDGTKNITATITNTDGNIGPLNATPLALILDTTPAVVGTPSLSAATDSGISTSDGITNISAPVIQNTGTTTEGTTVTISSNIDGTIQSPAVVSGGYSTVARIAKTGTITTTGGSPAVAGTTTTFVIGDVGRQIWNAAGTTLIGTIGSFTSATSVTLTTNALSIVTGASFSFGLSQGTHTITVSGTDVAGNPGSSNASIKIDYTGPAITPITILSNNANTSLAKIGDQVSVKFTTNEPLGSTPPATIDGKSATVTGPVANVYTATVTTDATYTEAALGFVISSIADVAGNAIANKTAVTDATSVTFDKTAPTISPVTILSNNTNVSLAKIGDQVSVKFTTNQPLLNLPTATIDGKTATVTGPVANVYTATVTTDATYTEAALGFAISGIADLAGNTVATITAVTDATSVTFDKTPPTISPVTILSNNTNTSRAKIGDQVSVNFTTNQALLSLPTATIDGKTATVTGPVANVYTATVTTDATYTEAVLTFALSGIADLAGNTVATVTAVTDATSVTFDKTPAVISPITILSNNANTSYAKTGDQVSVKFTTNEPLLSSPTATIDGKSATVTGPVANVYTATVTTDATYTEAVLGFVISGIVDATGNATANKTAVTDATSVTFDKTAPSITPVTILSNNANPALAKIGNTVSVKFTSNELLSTPTATIDGHAAIVTGPVTSVYTASVTMDATYTEGTPLTFVISNIADAAGNAITNITAVTDATSVTFDKTPPTISPVTILSNNTNTSRAKIGDQVSVNFTTNQALLSLPTATIDGKTATVTGPVSNVYTATVTTDATYTEAVLTFALSGIADLAGNTVATVTAVTDATSVTFDKTPAVISPITILSNNANTSYAKTGDQVSVKFTTNEPLLSSPTATIDGKPATVTGPVANVYTATVTTDATYTEAVLGFVISGIVDATGNATANKTAVTDATSVTFDKTPPSITPVTILSNNANPALAKIGNTVSVKFTSNELLSTPTATIDGKTATVTGPVANVYTASVTMDATYTEGTPLTFVISNIADAAGNVIANITAVTDATSVTFDKTSPVITPITILSNNANTSLAKIGDQVSVKFTSSETLLLPTVTIDGHSATVTGPVANVYTATVTTDASYTQAALTFIISSIADLAGNTIANKTAVTDGSSVTFDKTSPVISPITILSNNANTSYAKTGDQVSVKFTTNEPLLNLPTATIDGHGATVTGPVASVYTATVTTDATYTEAALTFVISGIADLAGNTTTNRTTVTDASSVTFDKTPPVITPITILSNNANPSLAKIGNTVSVKFTSNELLSTPTATIDGHAAVVSGPVANVYTATVTMDASYTEGTPLTFVISNIADAAGNAIANKTAVTDATSVTFDKTSPVITPITILSNNANTSLAKIGDQVSVKFTSSETLLLPTVTIDGHSATVTGPVANVYTATVTTDASYTQAALTFIISSIADLAGNAIANKTAVTDASSVTFDKTSPVISPITILSNNANTSLAKIGNTVSVKFTTNEPLLNLPTATIDGHSATVTGPVASVYTATVTTDATYTEAALTFVISGIADLAGNTTANRTTVTDASSVTFDKTPPVITPITILSNNANTSRAKIGDQVSVKFTSNELLLLPTVTIDGHSAVVTGPVANVYTATVTTDATYTEAALTFIISSIADAAGNAIANKTAVTDGSSVIFDKTSAVISPITILSNNANTSRAKIGDQVSVKFTTNEPLLILPTATIDGHSATVTGPVASVYTATVTTDASYTEAALTFVISGITDLTGNTTSNKTAVTDATSVTFDKTPPVISPITILSNNANTSLAKIGNTVSVKFTTNETLLNLPTATIDGHSAVVTGPVANVYTATVTTDATYTEAVLTFIISGIADAAGNAIANKTAVTDGTSVTFDKTPPVITPITILSNNASPSRAKIGDQVSVKFTSNELLLLPTVTIDGHSAVVTGPVANVYTATVTADATYTEAALTFIISSIADAAGNAIANKTAVTDGSSVTFDKTLPSVTAITLNTTSTPLKGIGATNGTTNTTTAVFNVNFSEPVMNVDGGDFTPVFGNDVSGADLFPGLSLTSVVAAPGTGNSWNVTVTYPVTATGWVRIDYNNNSVQDLTGNPVSAIFSTTTSFPPATGNFAYTVAYAQPPAQPSGFSVNATTTLSKTVTWNPTLVPVPQATHYLVMIRESVTGAAFPTPADGTPIADDLVNTDGLQILNVANTGAANLTAIFSGLKSGYSHDFIIYAYTLSANNATDNIDYLTTAAPTITNSLTNIATFTKIKNVSAPTGISSLINAQHGVAALTFDISDDDGSPAVDNSPTKFNTLVVTQGGANTTPTNDWTQVIAGAELFDATTGTTYHAGVVASNTITFSGIPSTNATQVGFITDNTSKTYNLMIWLQNPLSATNKQIIDNLQFDFIVNNASITYNDVSNNQQSSQLAASQLAQTGPGRDVIQVVAQKLVFDPLPQNQIGVASNFPTPVAPTVKALDNNNNWDLDYNASISVTNSASLAQFSGHTTFPLGGVLTLNNYQLLAPGTTTIQVTHTSGSAVVDATTSPATVTAVLSTKTVISAAAGTEPASISSLTTALSGATGTQQNAVQNFDFTITDDVAADGTNFTDNDGLPTLIPNLIIKQDPSNDAVLIDWRKIIAGAELSSGAKSITGIVEPTLGQSLVFSSINTAAGELGNVPDGTAKVYVLKIWLKNPVDPTIIDLFDNKSLAFLISQAEITVGSSPTSSTMQVSSTNSTAPTNKITVDATQLDFTTPNVNSSASLNVDFPIVVKARDVNNGLDIDFNGTIRSFTNTTGVTMSGAPVVGTDAFASGQISYPNLRYITGNNNDDVTLAISAGAAGACNGTTTICSVAPPAPTTPTIILSSSSSSVLVFDPSFSYSNRLAYIYNQDITSSATSLALAQYKLFDGDGTNNDADGASTNISSITFAITTLVNGTGSPVNGNKDIKQISLYDNSGNEIVSTRTTLNNASTVTFSGLSIITPGDFTSTTFTVRASFNNTVANVQDKDIIQLTIINVDQVSGSKLDQTVPAITGGTLDNATNVTGATPTPNTVNKIDVIATKLDFVIQPGAFAGINQPVSTGTLRANDQGGLLDLEFSFPAVLTTPAANTAGSFSFSQGLINLTGMTYTTVGNGTLTVTANGINSNQTGTTLGLPNVSTQCVHVDVLNVSTSIATGGVITTTNLAGGAIDKVIFGVTFTAPYQNLAEPKLNSFRIGFGNPASYPLNTIFTNIRIFENNSATFGGSDITSFGGTVAFDNTTNSDLIITVPSRSLAVPLSYFVEVDVVSTASGATPLVLPSVKDLGFGDPTDTNIGTTQGSATSNISGQTYNFSAIFPPTLVSSYPASGQINVDVTQPDISLTFSVPVWSLDGKIYIYDGANDALVGSIPLSSSGANSGAYAGGTVANLGNPLKFNLQALPPGALKSDHLYYIKITAGAFNGSAALNNTGVMDQAGNLFAGINVAGTLYFKTANPNPPNMLATPTAAADPSISNATVTGGIISAVFDQPGKAFYLVLPVGTPTPTPTQIYTGTHPSMVASGNFAVTQIKPNSQFGVITPTAALTAGITYDVWVSAVSYSEKSGVLTQIPATAPLHYGSSAKVAKTGTITATTTSTSVIGVGTLFTSQLVTGRTIFDATNNAIGVIASITDDTHLTVTFNPSTAVAAGTYKASGFEIGATGPTLQFIPAAASSSVNLNTPSISICTNAFQTLNQPIIITESSTKSDFSAVGNQKFNLVLPAGFVFDVSLTGGKPTYGQMALNGTDFSTNVTGSGTITTTISSSTVIGVSTSFTSELSVGDMLYDATGSTLIGTISSITNNTTLVLTANAAIAVTGTAYKENFVTAGSPHLGFVGNTILTVGYFNNGSATIDNLVISGLRIISTTTTSGDITRFGGNALIAAIPDLSKVATLGSTNAAGISFSNSYSIQTFNNKIVTTIPDNFNDPNLTQGLATLLIPDPPSGDFGASTFSGAGVNGSLLNLTAVTLGTPFNITINHKDNNGCPSTNFNQYTVYDHNTAIADLNPEYCSTNSNFKITNPTALATVGVATHDIHFDKLQSYYLDDLKVDVPAFATDPSDATKLSTDQIIFGPIGGSGWSNVLRNSLITKLFNQAPVAPIGPGGGYLPINNPLPGHEYFNYRIDEAIVLNAKSIDNNVPKNPYDYFIATSPQGNIYYTGGSLGIVQFTGTYQSIANASVRIPLQQNVQFFVPAVPIIETNPGSYLDASDPLNPPGPTAAPPNPGSSNKGTPVFCQLGGLIIINGFPAASAGSSTGTFTLRNAVTNGVIYDKAASITPAGFADNGNGTASIDPTLLTNNFADIKIVYDYSEIGKPCSSTATQIIRITPNPVASFTLSTPTGASYPHVNNANATCANQALNFVSGSTSTDPANNTIKTWSWNFGDPTSATNTSSIANPTQTYASASTAAPYNVTLGVTSFFGCASVTTATPTIVGLFSKPVNVGAIPVVKYKMEGVSTSDLFKFNSNSQLVPFPASGSFTTNNTIDNTVVSTNDFIASYDWSFGDTGNNITNRPKSASLPNDNAFNNDVVTFTYAGADIGARKIDLKVTTNLGCINSLSLQQSFRDIVVLPRKTITAGGNYNENFETTSTPWQPWFASTPTQTATVASSWNLEGTARTVIKPDPSGSNGAKFWTTDNGGTLNKYNQNERSALYSPSLDLSALVTPMVSFDNMIQLENSDGLVIEYSLDNLNISNPQKAWNILGKIGDGVNWITDKGIAALPGNQTAGLGWTGKSNISWQTSKHTLDTLGAPGVPAGKVVFRFALGSVTAPNVEGVAIDNVRFGDRTRTILLESFANTANATPSAFAAGQSEEKYQNTKIAAFPGTTLGTQVIKVNYHVNFPATDPFNNDNPADPSSRALYYGITETPRSRLDGAEDSQDRLFSQWGTTSYGTRSLQLAQAALKINMVPAAGKLSITVDITAVSDLPANTILQIAVLENAVGLSTLSTAQQAMVKTGETTFNYIIKKMVPNAAGTRFGTTLLSGAKKTFPATGTFDWMPDPTKLYAPANDLALVVFLQNELTNEIYQVSYVSAIPDPSVITGLEPVSPEQIVVYPVPANQEMHIQLPGALTQPASLQMIDQVGRVATVDRMSEGTNSKVINTADLSSGVYILQIDMGNGNITRKKVMVVH